MYYRKSLTWSQDLQSYRTPWWCHTLHRLQRYKEDIFPRIIECLKLDFELVIYPTLFSIIWNLLRNKKLVQRIVDVSFDDGYCVLSMQSIQILQKWISFRIPWLYVHSIHEGSVCVKHCIEMGLMLWLCSLMRSKGRRITTGFRLSLIVEIICAVDSWRNGFAGCTECRGESYITSCLFRRPRPEVRNKKGLKMAGRSWELASRWMYLQETQFGCH